MKHDIGAFFQDVAKASLDGAVARRIIAAAPATSGNEGTGQDGGFAAPTEFSSAVVTQLRERSLLGLCSTIRTSRNSVSLPVVDQAPWADDTFRWDAELAAASPRKPAFGLRTFRLSKLIGLVPISDELLEDAPGLADFMQAEMPRLLTPKVNTAIIRGSGSGQPVGILNSPALISIAREATVAESASKMVRRLPGESQASACFIHNPSYPIPSTPGLPKLLEGLPCYAVEACSEVGTVGDVILASMDHYQIVLKDMKVDLSFHFYFDASCSAYRYIFRVQGNPMPSAPWAAQYGDDTRSPFIALEDSADSPPSP